MSKKARKWLLVLFVGLSSMAVAFAGGQQGETKQVGEKAPVQQVGEPQYGGTLTYGYVSEMDMLDGHLTSPTIGRAIASIIWEPLIDWDENLNLQPGLATSWKAGEDGKSWIFMLRKDVKFHHGKDFEAKDVKFSIERILNPKNPATFKATFEVIESVEVVDKYTVKFNLKRRDGSFPSKFPDGAGIMPYDITPPERKLSPEDKISGTGPFKYVEWKKNDYIRFSKNENYWRKGLPYIDKLILKAIPDANVRLAALKGGDVDIIEWVPLAEAQKLMAKPSPDYSIQVGPYGAETGYICPNIQVPPLNDVRVRQAIAYAIDKEQIVQGAWRGFGEPVNQPFSTKSMWYCPVEDKYGHANIEKAKELLAEAGYPNGFRITWGTTTGYEYMLLLTQVVQMQLAKVGILVDIELYDWTSYVQKVPNLEFKIWNTGVPGRTDPVQWYPLVYKEGSPFNYIAGNYKNKEVEALLDQAEAASDFAERKALYTKVVQIIERDLPMIYTSTGSIGFGWRSNVHGFKPHTNAWPNYAGGGLAFTWIK